MHEALGVKGVGPGEGVVANGLPGDADPDSRAGLSALTSMGPRFLSTIPPLGSICVTGAIVDQAALRDPVFGERERAGFWRAR